VIDFDNLTITFRRDDGELRALREFTLSIQPGEAIALVGESGSGKTTAARATLGDIGRSGIIEAGTVKVWDQEPFRLSTKEVAEFRHSQIGYVPQNPGASLNPVRRTRRQIAEMIPRGSPVTVESLLERVQLDPALASRYPHQLSGGQQQRISLAIALANSPKALILDEPTTGLDVAVQVEILRLFRSLVDDGLAVLYVTHDLGAAAVVADRVAVLYAGDVLETGQLREVYRRPQHPYTEALLAAVPTVTTRVELRGIPGFMLPGEQRGDCCVFHNRCSYREDQCEQSRPDLISDNGQSVRCFRAPSLSLTGVARVLDADAPSEVLRTAIATPGILAVSDLTIAYRGAPPDSPAVNDATLSLARGEALALVGESGSGKTSLARGIIGLVAPAAGSVTLDGDVVAATFRKRTREQRRRIQYVFQNSTLALNPRHTIEQVLTAPLDRFFDLNDQERNTRILELLEMVSLPQRVLPLRSSELSGGEQQRVAIARALSANPDVMICDEVVSALDVSVQAAIVKLLGDLQAETGVAMLFISHDLGVVRAIADRTAVMHNGHIVEEGPTELIFRDPQMEYTKMLLSSVPDAAAATEPPLASAAT
jgi:peptide/nickel transport system ATP-binding protein